MVIMKNFFQLLHKANRHIKLIDKCLIVFMVILLFQSLYILFANQIISQNNNSVDVVIRSAIASIFGYFISANFIKSKEASLPTHHAPATPAKKPVTPPDCFTRSVQVIIVTVLGLISLVALIINRNLSVIPDSSIPTITQLRDIVFGCVGFLLGYPSDSMDVKK